jgi:conjugative relaxase-like TrwC/TraI family protein
LLTIAKCRDLDYYEREVIEGREEYLSEGGNAPGRWVGSLAAADGYSGIAERDALLKAFAGVHPDGFKMTAHDLAVNGFDLTLSPSKSVSLIWALGSESDARHVEEALYAARDEVERYLESTACLVRRGHAGAVVEPGKGFFGAVFMHRTSRLGDPGVHLHWAVFNVTEGPDGRRTALDGKALYRERYAAEAVFQATLRRELTTRLGLVFDEMDRHGVAEVAGVSADMRRAFSRRRAEIVKEMNRLGVHSGAGARVATLNTRKPKLTGISEAELRAEWKQRAGDLRFDLSNVPRVVRTPTLRVDDGELSTMLIEEHATFEQRDTIRAAARAARQGATLDQIVGRASDYRTSDDVVEVATGRWTTKEILAAERSVVAIASGPTSAKFRALEQTVADAVSNRPSLSREQTRMVESLCLYGRPVDVVIGRAGAGKTFTLDAVREAFENSDHRVIGVSLAARAARELQSGAGIRSTTAHSLHSDLESGRRRLKPGDVLVIDEAGMLGTQMMADLVGKAQRAETKVILVGDPKQLPPIEAGGLFASLATRIKITELTENRRQRDPGDRFVADALRKGLTELAVRRLDANGRVTIAHNSDTLRDQMALDWWELHTAGRDAVMGAAHRSDVDDLNSRVHVLLEASDSLGPLVAEVDDYRYCVGDQVLGLLNRYDLGILNGDVGTVTGAADNRLHVQFEDGREVHLPLDYVTDHLRHAYARTVHKTQGLTCEVNLLLGDDALYAELGYTAVTRATQENRVYTVVPAKDFADEGFHLQHLVSWLERSHAKTAAIDYLEPPEIA